MDQDELSFSARLNLREQILSWISRDVGLSDFLLPAELTSSWKPEDKKMWTDSVIDTFLQADGSKGKVARQRIISQENAGALRRICTKLRKSNADYRDVTHGSVALETLWDSVSPELEDAIWARCSLLFDTAVIHLRLAYLWMYMKQEKGVSEANLPTRKAAFEVIVENFFIPHAPTDDKQDKHSDNFRKLLEAWKSELLQYPKSDDFEKKLKALQETQSLNGAAAFIEKFMDKAGLDQSWILKMQKMDEEVQQKLWTRRKSKPRKKKSPELLNDDVNESVSSYEPKDNDSDFNVDDQISHEEFERLQQDNEYDSDFHGKQHEGIRSTRRVDSARSSGRVTRHGSTAVPSYDEKMKSSEPDNEEQSEEEGEERIDAPAETPQRASLKKQGARTANQLQSHGRERAKKLQKSLFDDERGENSIPNSSVSDPQPEGSGRKLRSTSSTDQEEPGNIVKDDVVATPRAIRGRERQLVFQKTVNPRVPKVDPRRTRVQTQSPQSVQRSPAIPRSTRSGAVRGAEVSNAQPAGRRVYGRALRSGSGGGGVGDDGQDSPTSDADDVPPTYEMPDSPRAVRGDRPVVRDQGANLSRSARRQQVNEAMASSRSGESQLASSVRRTERRRSTRTNPGT